MSDESIVADKSALPTPEEALKALDELEYSDTEFDDLMSLYEDTMSNIQQGEIVEGTVLDVDDGTVVIDIGFKSEGSVPIDEFSNPEDIVAGLKVEVFLETVEDQEGQIVLSKTKADFMRVWDRIKDAYDSDQMVEGRLVRRIKGGIVVDLFGVDAFLPGSQIDIKQVKNFDQFIGEVFPFRIIKLNKNRRNIVVSRRVVLEEERERLRKQILQTLEVGQIRKGSVKNITDFGGFIDLGGLDGLLHITDISWGRVGHPSDVLSIGDDVEVKVLNYDKERERISLGMKQLQPHPWENVGDSYPKGARIQGKVVSITDYGAFVELEEGVEGLVHISEMSWTQHIRHPSKLLSIGDEVTVVILNVDADDQKISLGLKQVDTGSVADTRRAVSARNQAQRQGPQSHKLWSLRGDRGRHRRVGAHLGYVVDQAGATSERDCEEGPGARGRRDQHRQGATTNFARSQANDREPPGQGWPCGMPSARRQRARSRVCSREALWST